MSKAAGMRKAWKRERRKRKNSTKKMGKDAPAGGGSKYAQKKVETGNIRHAIKALATLGGKSAPSVKAAEAELKALLRMGRKERT